MSRNVGSNKNNRFDEIQRGVLGLSFWDQNQGDNGVYLFSPDLYSLRDQSLSGNYEAE